MRFWLDMGCREKNNEAKVGQEKKGSAKRCLEIYDVSLSYNFSNEQCIYCVAIVIWVLIISIIITVNMTSNCCNFIFAFSSGIIF